MAARIWQVDAFTDRPFAGNPAAVAPLEGPAPADWMQALAAEMNVSETAFLWPEGDAYRLRWFTPRVEVRLCGHATLAAAHVLWESGRLAAGRPASFETDSGRLVAWQRGERIELDFPARPVVPLEADPEVAAALGVRPVALGRNVDDLVVEVATAAEVRDSRPDFAAVRALPVRGVSLTAAAAAGSDADFVSRFFAPAVGVDEDPVTGSAHCALALYWGERLGKTELAGLQLSPRGGRVEVRWRGDRVGLLGRAVTVLAGELAPAAGPPDPAG